MNESKRQCICGKPESRAARISSSGKLYCSFCVQRILQSHWNKLQQAQTKRDEARAECAQFLHDMSHTKDGQERKDISELLFESQRQRERLQTLKQQCSELAVQVASQAVQNEEHRGRLFESSPQQATSNSPQVLRSHLHRLNQALCEGAMKHGISTGRSQIGTLRCLWALQAFQMHRLQLEMDKSKVMEQKTARGIGKISGLPLPHAGPELYGVLPPIELQSALRLVASLTSTVAQCLGIPLPHPILLRRFQHAKGNTTLKKPKSTVLNHPPLDILDWSENKPEGDENDRPQDKPFPPAFLASSTSSLLSMLDGSNKSSQRTHANSRPAIPSQPSMDPSLVSDRIDCAMAAIMAENNETSASKYSLAAEVMHLDEFAIALQLLQNNIIALCIRAGVPVGKLWPAEAVLLNLHALKVHCQDQIQI